jgi:hypothetical protein
MKKQVLLVHPVGHSWDDLIQELASAEVDVHAVTSLYDTETRIRARRPDVFVIDGAFERGVDLLLQARQTASGSLTVVVRRLTGGDYGATLPGPDPSYVSPLTAVQLAQQIRDAMTAWRGGEAGGFQPVS